MFQSHINTLSLASIASKTHSSHYSKEKEEQLIAVLVRSGLNEYSLNYLYHLVKHKVSEPHEQMDILFRVQFIIKVSQWIISERTLANGLEKALSPRSQLQIIELMDILITLALDFPNNEEHILSTSQEILTYFYEVV